MEFPDDLRAFEVETQARMDDASSDHLYVMKDGPTPPIPMAAGYVLSASDAENARRFEALSFSVAQSACIWRANGGVGRMVVRAKHMAPSSEHPHGGLEAHLSIWTGAADVFEAIHALEAEEG